ncbi:ribonuclease h1 [Plakobranchus ocellatus]|uniref:Ribonuclease H1 n=1 Tax=Plakobranchus ocellatus TaxID=259542 RepID=A0AAV3ZJ24_9GAST|nr:ribonuclease h1 [Plakobranchus ocellatus]
MFTFAWWSSSLNRAMSKAGTWFYAVKNGRVPGIYHTWAECESQVKGFSQPKYKKFASLQDAQKFIADGDSSLARLDSMTQSPTVPKTTSFCYASGSCSSTRLLTNNGNSTPDNSTSLASLSSKIAEMQSTINRLVGVIEGLSSDVTHIQQTVARLDSAVFMAPGTKRNFSTLSSNPKAERDSKRIKRNKTNTAAFTGAKFEEEDGVHVYTDGGCFDNGRNGARAGIGVYWDCDDPNNVSERLPGRPSNNRAEIHAAVKAVQIAKRRGIKNLIVHTDSQFLINGITKWIKGWKKNGWKLTTGHPVINKDDFVALDNELSDISVKWVYVKGHSGDLANEEADKLAKQGADKAELS